MLTVVTSFYPMYIATLNIVDGVNGVRLENLSEPQTGCLHDFQLTPEDMKLLSTADVFVINGGGIESFMSDVAKAYPKLDVVEACEDVALLSEDDADSDHDHDHDDHDGHLHDGHEEDIEYDEHIWTSPVNAMALCRAICDTLCEADPDNADGYRARLADYLDELQALDETFRDITDHAARRLLVFGDRFPLLYFCREYDLDYRAAFHGCAGDTEPSLATLKYLIDVVEEQEIPVVYTIELSSRKVAQAIAETTGAQVRTFHSCQTVSRAEFDGGATYISLMTANAAALKEGLS